MSKRFAIITNPGGVMEFLRNLTEAIRYFREILTHLKEILMKLNELGGTVAEIRTQLVKVFGEQQATIDAAKAKIKQLEEAAANADVPEEVTSAIGELKTLIQQADDQNPDVTPEPPVG